MGSSHQHRHARGHGKSEDGRTIKLAQYSGTYTNELSELYAGCLAKALSEKKLFFEDRDKTKDSELGRKLTRHTLNPKSDDANAKKLLKRAPAKNNKSRGSNFGRRAVHFAVPVINRTPAR